MVSSIDQPASTRSLVLAMLLCSVVTTTSGGEYTCTTGDHHWVGTGDWFASGNWDNCPFTTPPIDPPVPLLFGVMAQYVNGVFQGYRFPAGPAILERDFAIAPELNMHPWDGPTEIIIRNGATLTTQGYVGYWPWGQYQPTRPLWPSTITLEGGYIAGQWVFYPDSRLNIASGTDLLLEDLLPDGTPGALHVSGNIGTLSIAAGASLTFRSKYYNDLLFRNRIDNAGTIRLESRVVSGTLFCGMLRRDGPLELSGGGELLLLCPEPQTVIFYGNSDEPLINIDNTIRGTGLIYGPIINRHIIRAEGGRLTFPWNGGGQFEVTIQEPAAA